MQTGRRSATLSSQALLSAWPVSCASLSTISFSHVAPRSGPATATAMFIPRRVLSLTLLLAPVGCAATAVPEEASIATDVTAGQDQLGRVAFYGTVSEVSAMSLKFFWDQYEHRMSILRSPSSSFEVRLKSSGMGFRAEWASLPAGATGSGRAVSATEAVLSARTSALVNPTWRLVPDSNRRSGLPLARGTYTVTVVRTFDACSAASRCQSGAVCVSGRCRVDCPTLSAGQSYGDYQCTGDFSPGAAGCTNL